MRRSTWRKHHKWFGLIFTFFMLMFCMRYCAESQGGRIGCGREQEVASFKLSFRQMEQRAAAWFITVRSCRLHSLVWK